MSADYTVIFLGTEAEGEQRREVMRGVQDLLKIGEQHIISLFDNPQGVTLYNTDDLHKAQRLIRRLERVGASVELIDNRAQAGDAANSDGNDAVARHKRERIRQSILAGEQHNDADASDSHDQRPGNAPQPAVRRRNIALIAAGILGVGVLGALSFEGSTPPSAQAPATAGTQATAPTTPEPGVTEAARTIAHANSVTVMLTGIDWQQTPVPEFDDGFADTFAEPWLNAPPTAAGGSEHASRSAKGGLQIDDEQMLRIVSTWQSAGQSTARVDPLDLLRLRHLAGNLVRAGHAERALSTLTWLEDPEQRLTLLDTIARQASLHDDPSLVQRVRAQLNTMSDSRGNPTDAVLAMLALEGLRDAAPDAATRANADARLLRVINGSQLAAADAVMLHALVAARHAKTGPATRWFAEANHAFRNIEDPIDQLTALAGLARAYRAAGEQQTADELAWRIRAGSDALGRAVPGRLQVVEQLQRTYLALGQIDAASELLERTTDSPLDADLQRAQLAVALAAQKQGIAARGLVTTIAHPVARARANTRLSAIAALRSQHGDAQLLADAAVNDIRRLPTSLRPLLTSDLTQPLPDDIARAGTPESVTQDGSHSDRRLAIVATNLAWNRVGTTARQLSQGIGDEMLRTQTQERIDQLATLFSATAGVNLAGTLN